MARYYDITIVDEERHTSVSYWADSFSVEENGILRVQSAECGNIVTRIKANEKLSVSTVDVKEEWEEMMECYEQAEPKGE